MSVPVIESPCIRQCKLDEARTHCVSCWRTLDDIRAWKEADEAHRADIVRRASERATCNELQKTLDDESVSRHNGFTDNETR